MCDLILRNIISDTMSKGFYYIGEVVGKNIGGMTAKLSHTTTLPLLALASLGGMTQM
jgi:hypothetical protein